MPGKASWFQGNLDSFWCNIPMSRKVVFPPYSSLVRSHLEEFCVQFQAPQYKRLMDILVRVQQRAIKTMRGPGASPVWGQAERAVTVSLEKIRLREFLSIPEGLWRTTEAVSPHWHSVTGQEPMATKSNTERIHLNMMKHIFSVKVTIHWHKLPTEVLESPPSEIPKKPPGYGPRPSL